MTYRAAIRREIERHKRYPARAKMMRKQGVVSVSFSVGQMVPYQENE